MHEIIYTLIPGDWVSEIAKQYGVIVRLISSIPTDDGSLLETVELSSSRDNIKDVISHLSRRKDVKFCEMEILGKDHALGMIRSDAAMIRNRIAGMNLFIDAAKSSLNGSIRYILLTCDESVIKEFRKDLSRHGKIESIKKISGRVITAKDEEILKLAMRAGFYEYPKRSGIQEIARMLGVSPLEVVKSLRTAQKKVLTWYLLGMKLKR